MLIDEGREDAATSGEEEEESSDSDASEENAGAEGSAGEESGEEGSGEGEEGSGEESDEDDIEVPEDFDPKRALRTIKAQREAETKLKGDLKDVRSQLRVARKEAATLKAGAEGEVEELTNEVETLRTENATLKETVDTYQSTARRANFLTDVDLPQPDVAYALIPNTGVELEWNDKDQPVNLKQVKRALIQKYPHLFGDVGIGGGAGRGNGLGETADMNDLLRGGR